MSISRRSLYPALAVVSLALLGSAALAQDGPTDQAKDLLQRGLKLFEDRDYRMAQQALVQASQKVEKDKAALSDPEKKQLQDRLGQLTDLVREQERVLGDLRKAEEALRTGQLDEAIKGLEAVLAKKDLLPKKAGEENVKAMLGEAKAKRNVAAAAPTATPAAAGSPGAAPAAKATPAAVAAAAPPAAPARKTEDLAARKAKARQLLDLGKKAIDDKKVDEAVRFFQQARELDPDLVEAQQLLQYAASMVAGGSPSDTGILSRLQRRMLLAKQAGELEINKSMRRSQEALAAAAAPTGKASDYQNALQEARAALDTLEANKSFFSASEYQNQKARISDHMNAVTIRQEKANQREVARQAAEAEKVRLAKLTEDARATHLKIASLREQAAAHRGRKEYGKALEVVDQVLLLDPGNGWAAGEKQNLTEFEVLMKEGGSFRDQRINEHRQLEDLRASEIPWYDLVRYPKNWKQITEERKEFKASAAGESEVDAAVREKLKREIEQLSFHEIEFKEVIGFLRDYSQVNIHVNWPALKTGGIEQTTKVSVELRKVPVQRALKLILKDVSGSAAGAGADLRYVIDGGVLVISTKEDLAKEPQRRVYDVRDLLIPMEDFKGPRIELTNATQQTMNETSTSTGIFDETTSGAGGRGGRGGEEEEQTKEERVKAFVDMIKKAVDPPSWQDETGGGGGTGFIQVTNGQLVVTQTAENHEALAELIEKLREARTIQITVESRFITVDSGFLNSIGVDLDFYFNLGSRVTRANGPFITDPWTGNTVPTYTDAAGNTVPSYGTVGPTKIWPGNKPGDDSFTPIGAKGNSASFLSGLQTLIGGNIGLAAANNGPALSIGGTFLDDIQVDFLIQATQAHAATRQLTAPRVTVANGTRAYITVARQQAYIREYIPIVSGNAIAYRPIIGYVPTGAMLEVGATASADRRYVLMDIRPQVCTQEGQPTEVAMGGIGGVLPVHLPTVTVQELKTNVSVPDGGTLLLGGQKLAGESEREMGAPILSKIPIIDRMFTNRGTVRDERTLLILVKPKIMINESAERNEKLYLEEPRLP